MNINTVGFMSTVAAIATIFFTVLACKFIVPEHRRAKLNKLGQFLHDVFNFKFLIVEKLLRFLYVLSTIACVCFGICMLLGISIYHSDYSDKTYTDWYGLYGLLIAIVGPFAVRLSYEVLLMGILLVKNVIQINKKLKTQAEEEEYEMPSFKELIAKENFSFLKKESSAPANTPEKTE